MIQFSLPEWIEHYVKEYTASADIDERMSFVINASRRNVQEGTGGPFAAAIFERDSGILVALGVNLVTVTGLSILHAEMVAFASAQTKLNHYDLGATGFPVHELVTSTEPCAMCYGATIWSGVRRVVCGAREADARTIGFDEGPKVEQWWQELEQRGIEVIRDRLRAEAAAVLEAYGAGGGTIYNSRTEG
jgi:tRNA(Arg) A34 adenosine deaminase TadA